MANEPIQPGSEPPDPKPVSVPEDKVLSLSDAARLMRQARRPQETPEPTSAPPPEAAAEPQESTAPADDAAPPQEAPGETQAPDTEAEELPAVEAPRSWAKDAKERWQALPRETQEYLAERERDRERELRRGQDEAAEKLKGLSAKEQAVEQARQQYETALPILLQNLQSGMAGEFADIKTMADVQKMASEDWPRYIRWDAQQKQVAAVQQEMQSANARQFQEQQTKWSEYASTQDKLLTEKVPEFADRAKASKLQDAAVKYLKDLGFDEQELGRAWTGQSNIPFRDYRMQMLVLDGIKYREAQAAAKKVAAKPVPPVQRPGVSQGKGAQSEAQVQSLTKQLQKAHGMNALKIAANLARAKRGAR